MTSPVCVSVYDQTCMTVCVYQHDEK
jgi:hypothetical protein